MKANTPNRKQLAATLKPWPFKPNENATAFEVPTITPVQRRAVADFEVDSAETESPDRRDWRAVILVRNRCERRRLARMIRHRRLPWALAVGEPDEAAPMQAAA